ncbi:MAG TPA: UDP-N-acetylmuramoyl-tripeptide--D-alanyl-D-alanine ligase [Chthoniobacterales bacterium]|nr:UDP-N-acetylmuramoyl-tripeptide--D-alanyl-D-alanine ligase [Chthoniobacterales bacterium]
MDARTLSQLAEYANARLEAGDPNREITRLSTDSRTIQAGDLFVPIRGENFDGHQFVEQTAEKGAAGAVVEHSWRGDVPAGFALIRVADSLAAYQQIAAGYRRSLSLKVIGITGSNGKTSTKDFVAAALSRRARVTKTEGNFNNHVGLPQTILNATAPDEIGVWEMGMNHPGEIELLARIAAPDAAIITNIGIAHIEFMGSREAIALEKGMLAEAVGENGTVILNADDEFSESIARRTRAKVIFAGINSGSIRAEDISQSAVGSEFTILEGAHRCRAQLPVPGLHMVQNAILAVAAARAFGVSIEEAALGLAGASLTKARLQLRDIRGVQFLDDSYNANPDSTKAALRTLAELDTDGRRIAVLGHMGELGTETDRGHAEVGHCAAELRVDQLITVGEIAAKISEAAQAAGLENASNVSSHEEAAELLAETASAGDLVLVKGSRAARMERVLEAFSQQQPAVGTRV